MRYKIFSIVIIMFFLAGLLLIFFSPSIGISFVSDYIQKLGGSVDLSVYSTLLSAYIRNFQIIGFLISLVSALYFISINRKYGIK